MIGHCRLSWQLLWRYWRTNEVKYQASLSVEEWRDRNESHCNAPLEVRRVRPGALLGSAKTLLLHGDRSVRIYLHVFKRSESYEKVWSRTIETVGRRFLHGLIAHPHFFPSL